MGIAIASNALLLARATTLQALLNASHTLRLFQPPLNPTPGNVRADFMAVEATYNGYVPVSLVGQFPGAPVQVQVGMYQFASGTYTFVFNAGPAQTVAGWFIDDGANVKFSQLFPAPILMTVGVGFTLLVAPQEISRSLFP